MKCLFSMILDLDHIHNTKQTSRILVVVVVVVV